MTIDGKIARHSAHFPDWTSPEDKTYFQSMLEKSDVLVLGHSTFKTAEGPLSKRKCIVFTRSVPDTEHRGENVLYFNSNGPSSLLTILAPYRTVALLGGTQIYSYFLEHELIDEMYLTIEPIVFGDGLDLFHQENMATARFRLDSVRQLNEQGTVLMHYRKPPVDLPSASP